MTHVLRGGSWSNPARPEPLAGPQLVPELVPELVPGYGWLVWPSCRSNLPVRRRRARHRLDPRRPFPIRHVVVAILLVCCVVILVVPVPTP